MAFCLQTTRESLLAWPERQLNYEQLELFESLLTRRASGEPIAYITGTKSFWNLELKVTNAVLIPRPETELIVDWVLTHYPKDKPLKIADLGTGSGAIALAIANERPNWQVAATDICHQALTVAIENANNYHLKNVTFLHGNWCTPLTNDDFDIIISNPPYIAHSDPYLLNEVINYEPKQALIAEQNGYADLFAIAKQAMNYLKPEGVLIFEHGFQQAKILKVELDKLGYQQIETLKDLAELDRITLAVKSKNKNPT